MSLVFDCISIQIFFTGKLETTDKTYKYKMQVHEDQTDRMSQLSNLSSSNKEKPLAESKIDNQQSESDTASSVSDTLSENDSNEEDEENVENVENIENTEKVKNTESVEKTEKEQATSEATLRETEI